MAEIELSPDPQSTWGKSPEYVAQWNAKYGKAPQAEEEVPSGPPAAYANKDAWVAYAVSQGAVQSEAEALTKADLIAEYEGDLPAPGGGGDSGTPA